MKSIGHLLRSCLRICRDSDSDGGVNVVVETVDVLAFDFAAASQTAGQRLIVAGNLPYYITSPILMKLAENANVLDRAVLMVQREVADRVTAMPGSRDYGLLSVTVQIAWTGRAAVHAAAERIFAAARRALDRVSMAICSAIRGTRTGSRIVSASSCGRYLR